MSEIIIKCRGCGFEARNEDQLHRFRPNDVKKGKGFCRICHRIRRRNNIKLLLDNRWRGMIRRCYDIKNRMYHYYGGRGISVCDEWRANRQAFINWGLTHGFKPELWLDRINNNGNYSPENCRWTTPTVQGCNKRGSKTNLEKGTRICYKCHEEKPLSDFTNINSGPMYICKKCYYKGKEYLLTS